MWCAWRKVLSKAHNFILRIDTVSTERNRKRTAPGKHYYYNRLLRFNIFYKVENVAKSRVAMSQDCMTCLLFYFIENIIPFIAIF